ncbi:lactonase family protein [Halorhabdus salina]|uniref:lactonase family protein n=1 Tax=Halorhabdus salina TaxID=2750670 RepID=UPI00215D71BA|nr:lactonase family protein [Halorhabdus salina]
MSGCLAGDQQVIVADTLMGGPADDPPMPTAHTYVGTYTDGDSDGIYAHETTAGQLGDGQLAAPATDPSYLTIHPSGNYFYAVNEVAEGAVTAFAIDDEGELNQLNRRSIGPADPCHCSVDPTGQYLLVAHYTGGAISVVPIGADGSLGESTVHEREGSSVDPDRQTAPHPHTIRPGPDGRFVYVADLGTDEIVRYVLDDDAGTLDAKEAVSLHEGAGPRQFDYGPDGTVYCVNELDSTLTVLDREADGTLTIRETVETVPADYDGENAPGAVAVHPSGWFVYASNRGHDSIATFEVTSTGLEAVEIVSTRGECPRDFALDPDGDYLLVVNADTDSIVPFAIDDAIGTLDATGQTVTAPSPVCVRPQ